MNRKSAHILTVGYFSHPSMLSSNTPIHAVGNRHPHLFDKSGRILNNAGGARPTPHPEGMRGKLSLPPSEPPPEPPASPICWKTFPPSRKSASWKE